LRGRVREGAPLTTEWARDLRNHPTDAERRLWQCLRRHQFGGHKFRRQRPIGPYIVDFVCLEQQLIIELDGGQHLDHQAYDSVRDRYLRDQGFQVLRFWNSDILTNFESVEQAIWTALQSPLPNPPPEGGGERREGSA